MNGEDVSYRVIFALGEHNATRPCATCERDAEYYIPSGGEIPSTYRCAACIPDEIDDGEITAADNRRAARIGDLPIDSENTETSTYWIVLTL